MTPNMKRLLRHMIKCETQELQEIMDKLGMVYTYMVDADMAEVQKLAGDLLAAEKNVAKKKPGPKPKYGKTMTGAERARSYRARKKLHKEMWELQKH